MKSSTCISLNDVISKVRKKNNINYSHNYVMYLTNAPPFSMVCTLIYHRNDIIKFKTQVDRTTSR